MKSRDRRSASDSPESDLASAPRRDEAGGAGDPDDLLNQLHLPPSALLRMKQRASRRPFTGGYLSFVTAFLALLVALLALVLVWTDTRNEEAGVTPVGENVLIASLTPLASSTTTPAAETPLPTLTSTSTATPTPAPSATSTPTITPTLTPTLTLEPATAIPTATPPASQTPGAAPALGITPLPSLTPIPSATSAPAEAPAITGQVNIAEGARMRAGPGTRYDFIKPVEYGATVAILGVYTHNGNLNDGTGPLTWYKIETTCPQAAGSECKPTPGWLAESVLEIAADAQAQIQVLEESDIPALTS